MIASTISDVFWDSGAEPQRLRGNYGTFNTFDVMGVPPCSDAPRPGTIASQAPRRSSSWATDSGSVSSAATRRSSDGSCA